MFERKGTPEFSVERTDVRLPLHLHTLLEL